MKLNTVHKKILIVILFAVAFIQASAQSCKKKDIKESRYIISILSSDSMEGRLSGSAGEKESADFIVTLFRKNKLLPFFKDSYRHSFKFLLDSVSYTSTDLAGMINNKADSTIVFIAHYDHLGMGGTKSKSYANHKIHPGADDNASGIAALILLSNNLNCNKFKKFNYLFVAAGAHETGIWGAKSLVDSGELDSLKVKSVINLDMIGRLDVQTKILQYAIGDKSFISESVFKGYSNNSLNLVKIELPSGDHTPIVYKGFPVLFLTTGSHDDYHKISDTADKINYKGLLQIVRFVEYLITQK